MKIFNITDEKSLNEVYDVLLNRSAFASDIERGVEDIIKDIKLRGDDALCEYAKKFDNLDIVPQNFLVTEEELKAAKESLPHEDLKAITETIENVKNYSKLCCPQDWQKELKEGLVLGEKFIPLDRVGFYVPGGTAPLVSTVMHTVCLAVVAGVKELAVFTPATSNGYVHPAVLTAAYLSGATEVYRLGGVYGVAAAALGTKTIKKVEKIVGPGNAYVTAAKRQLYGYCAIDMVAGPSEILILADETANPKFIAADLLSQAEHGSGREQAVLVTTDATLPERVLVELEKQMADLSRSEPINKVYENGIFMIVVPSIEMAVEISNAYAPEHLEVQTKDCEEVAAKLTSAGAIFIGEYSPEPFGDFVAGPSHVLPTGGSAKFFSGLSTSQFYRRISTIKSTKDGLKRELVNLQRIANMEGLDGHRRSAEVRFED